VNVPAPVLNTAPESDSLTLIASPASPAASPISASVLPSSQPPPAAPTDGQTKSIDQASYSSASTLGLSDNLLLGALVAVFALAVIALVSAGGHRGSWRHH
jgi:hypothetical protein